jgi:transposase
MRCSRCGYTFHHFTGRWINLCGISCRDWMHILSLFSEYSTASAMARKLPLAYNTVYKALTVLRLSILAQSLDAALLLSRDTAPGLGLHKGRLRMSRVDADPNHVPVFGLLDRGNFVFLDYLPNLSAETVFHFHLNFSLGMRCMGHLVYTDRYQHYDSLFFFGNPTLPYHVLRSPRSPLHLESADSPFWAMARPLLMKYNGVTPNKFPLYLKEMEFRFNYREHDRQHLLAKNLCTLMPDLG